MGLWTSPPYALFILTTRSAKEVNTILREAYSGAPVDFAYFYVTVKGYESAPRAAPNGVPGSGTEPPVSDDFVPEFAGSTIRDCTNWLVKAPEEVCLERHHFVVVNDETVKRGKVGVVRHGDAYLKGDSLEIMYMPAEDSALRLSGLEFGTWEELRKAYNSEPVDE